MNDFQVQLKVKDEEYVKALKQQAEDVEELLERMRTEFRELQVRDVYRSLLLSCHALVQIVPDLCWKQAAVVHCCS